MNDKGGKVPAWVKCLMELVPHDAQLVAHAPDSDIEQLLGSRNMTFARSIATVLEGYNLRPALAERRYDVVVDPDSDRRIKRLLPGFRTISYADLRWRVEAVASALQSMGSVRPGNFVCIVGFSGIDYVTVDLACLYLQGVSVPVQVTSGREVLRTILANTAPTVMAVSADDLEIAAKIALEQQSVTTLIVIDHDDRVSDNIDLLAAAQAALVRNGSNVTLVTLDDLVTRGAPLRWELLPESNDADDRTAMLVHSSGTTGQPKGAILSDRHARASMAPAVFPWSRIRLCFAPMNHTMGRGTVYGTLAHGGVVSFTGRPDMSTLLEDLRLVRPTDGFFFPRALELIQRHYRNELRREGVAGRAIPQDELRHTLLGGRLRMIKGGSAPTTPEVRRFVVEDLGVEFIDRYGSTEAGNITVNDRVRRPTVIDYALRDVPDLGYLTTDQPFPRGELLVKTTHMISGYFKQPLATQELFDDNGFIHTGDIFEERGPDHLVFVDRRSGVIKLSQGEFVAASALGGVYENGSQLIKQVYVHGSSARSYLLAVVVPDIEAIVVKLGDGSTDEQLHNLLVAEIRQVALVENLKPIEIPRDVIVEHEPFSQENGLLTGLRKPVRPAIATKYGTRLEDLYDRIDDKRSWGLDALRSSGDRLGVEDGVVGALRASLGLEHLDIDSPYGFIGLGGDSLGAVEFSALLQELFGVEVPVGSILGQAATPRSIANRILSARERNGANLPSFADVHGSGARVLRAGDLDPSLFFGATRAPSPPVPAVPTNRTVLLTGATGFLGRFLCLAWLQQLASEGGELICLVRAADDIEARRRLEEVFTNGDARLADQFRALAAGRLSVLAGDVTQRMLGLEEIDYHRLATDVDHVVHAAALVNHALAYEHLFTTNVAGTAAIIDLATTARTKHIDFISSTAITRFLDRGESNDENSPLATEASLGDDYANGYGASKWAAEHLLMKATVRWNLDVNVFRGTMMLPHREYREQVNIEDIFTRLLFSVIATKSAPSSFYEIGSDGARARANYNGLPVDFMAEAIAGIGRTSSAGFRTFNVVNQNHDGTVSLDVMVDWIAEAGFEIERVDDYEVWFSQFVAKMQALPEASRRHSSLAIAVSLSKPSDPRKLPAGSDHFDAALRELTIGPRTPSLSRDFIVKCIEDLVMHGLVEPSEFRGA